MHLERGLQDAIGNVKGGPDSKEGNNIKIFVVDGAGGVQRSLIKKFNDGTVTTTPLSPCMRPNLFKLDRSQWSK